MSLLDPAFFCKTDHTPVVLMGSGGMGKTTALLRMAYYQKKTYSPLEPAITYLSLFDWKDGGDTYIQNRILENLRFKPHTDSMATARHELHRLLSAPICTKQGKRPVLILLLDGLNEASGDISLLQKEISELASKDGVRILLTSRSEPEGFSCQKIMLEQLKWEEVKKALEEHGILPPQNMELQELLHIPMLLSMYIRTALAEKKQLQIDTKEELLEPVFCADSGKRNPHSAGKREGKLGDSGGNSVRSAGNCGADSKAWAGNFGSGAAEADRELLQRTEKEGADSRVSGVDRPYSGYQNGHRECGCVVWKNYSGAFMEAAGAYRAGRLWKLQDSASDDGRISGGAKHDKALSEKRRNGKRSSH